MTADAEDPYVLRHRDGSLWARGQTGDDVSKGYWERFRKDGTRLRSGNFEIGARTGEWITYDRIGNLYKVTTIRKAPAGAKSS